MTTPTDQTSLKNLRVETHSSCILCSQRGEYVHEGLRDQLFGSSGLWNLRQCGNPACGLIWLDPKPTEEDLVHAYSQYYTHSSRKSANGSSFAARKYAAAKAVYTMERYGYPFADISWDARFLSKLLYLFPLRRGVIDAELMFLRRQPGGLLLDVGCGSGDWLEKMQQLGWNVEGLDVDKAAVQVARMKGLKVYCESLENLSLPNSVYDVATMNHVIEHVPNPLQLLAECLRILKKNGRLIITTPNTRSFARRVFGDSWRGLEPPRHLFLFTPEALGNALTKVGFSQCSVKTFNSLDIISKSYRLSRNSNSNIPLMEKPNPIGVYPRILASVEQALLLVKRSAGECLLAVAEKKD